MCLDLLLLLQQESHQIYSDHSETPISLGWHHEPVNPAYPRV